MQAIVTKYLGPTNTLPSRIRVAMQKGRFFVHYDCALNVTANSRAAAMEAAKRNEWGGTRVYGGLPDGSAVWSRVALRDCTDELTYLTDVEKFYVHAGV